MSKAHLAGISIFLLFAVAGLGLAALASSSFVAIAIFVIAGIAGSVVAGRLFDRLATPEEKRRDIEDRVRNPDI